MQIKYPFSNPAIPYPALQLLNQMHERLEEIEGSNQTVVDQTIVGSSMASDITFTSSTSDLVSDNVQEAIEELTTNAAALSDSITDLENTNENIAFLSGTVDTDALLADFPVGKARHFQVNSSGATLTTSQPFFAVNSNGDATGVVAPFDIQSGVQGYMYKSNGGTVVLTYTTAQLTGVPSINFQSGSVAAVNNVGNASNKFLAFPTAFGAGVVPIVTANAFEIAQATFINIESVTNTGFIYTAYRHDGVPISNFSGIQWTAIVPD